MALGALFSELLTCHGSKPGVVAAISMAALGGGFQLPNTLLELNEVFTPRSQYWKNMLGPWGHVNLSLRLNLLGYSWWLKSFRFSMIIIIKFQLLMISDVWGKGFQRSMKLYNDRSKPFAHKNIPWPRLRHRAVRSIDTHCPLVKVCSQFVWCRTFF